jgi:hypothetical protein
MSKVQLQKLRDAAYLAYEAAQEVTELATDPKELGAVIDYYLNGCPMISAIDILIGKASEP